MRRRDGCHQWPISEEACEEFMIGGKVVFASCSLV